MLHLLAVARGDAPADLVLTGGRVVNVFSGEIERVGIAIAGGRIAGLGDYEGRETINLEGRYVSPGLIDAHVHIESSLCLPAEFAKAVVPRGVTTVVTDPHEIANVAGVAGIQFMAEAAKGVPLNVIINAPSCVPATEMATAGGTITSDDIAALRDETIVHGLAEAMNFPGVIGGDAGMLAKLAAMHRRPIDGHAPGVIGKPLNAYVAAGVGSDHEAVSPEEAIEKLRRGLYVLIREATNARNVDALLSIVTPDNSRRICFCTDDRTPGDLLRDGSVDMMVRRAIAAGVRPIDAIRMATLNPSEWFGLTNVGAIAPGRRADLFTFDDLDAPTARDVWVLGGRRGNNGSGVQNPKLPLRHLGTETLALGGCTVNWEQVDLRIPARGKTIRVIGSQPDQLLTEHSTAVASILDGHAVADPSRDLLKMAVIERHRGTGNVGLGIIAGFGLERGAIAGTVAHDHHNLVLIGCDDNAMRLAGTAVTDMGGGLAVAVDGEVVAKLPLPIGGLMSDRPVAEVAAAYDACVAAARRLGSPLADPFMAMSFMALEVIPSLKLTDRGLVDVDQFRLVDLFV